VAASEAVRLGLARAARAWGQPGRVPCSPGARWGFDLAQSEDRADEPVTLAGRHGSS